jgi:DNA (cytosine-5)-methyltransferase 1
MQKLTRHQKKNDCHTKVQDLRAKNVSLEAELARLQNVVVPTTPKRKFIDLFCGIGGFHQALASLGAECVLACDIDEKCREVYKENYGIEPRTDVTKLVSSEIPDFDILCAGFPCQAFSHAGHQNGFDDTRGTLFRDICRILREKKPKYFILENVKNLKGHDKGKTWKTIYNCLIESGYTTYETPIVVSPHQLGIPQHRERVMIMGWRNDVLPEGGLPVLPKMSPPGSVNIKSILTEDCDVPEGTQLSTADIECLNLWEEMIQHFKVRGEKLPTFPIWSNDWDSTYDVTETEDKEKEEEEDDEEDKEEDKKIQTAYKIPEWKQKFIRQNRDFYSSNIEFLRPWLVRARSSASFMGSKRKFEWQAGKFQSGDSLWNLLFQFRPSGIRVKRATYSPALVAMAQIVYVGEKKRKLSPREVARLQSFPDTFRIPASAGVAYKQFGNSVNVEVIKWAAKQLLG